MRIQADRASTPRRLLAWAAAGVAALAAFTAVAFLVGPAHALDRTLIEASGLDPESADAVNVHHVAHTAKAAPVAILLVLCVVVALVRRRPERALAALLLVAGAEVGTQVLKKVLSAPRSLDAAGVYSKSYSYPSGHATSTLAIVLAALLVVPPRLRPLVAVIGGAWSLVVSIAMVALHRHFPSDLIAGYLVAGISGLVVSAGLLTAEARRRRSVRSGAAPRGHGPIGGSEQQAARG